MVPQPGSPALIPPQVAGRLAGVFLLVGAGVATGNAISAAAAGRPAVGFVVGAIGTAALGGVGFLLPWSRWHPLATLGLLAPGLALLSFANYASPDRYVAGVFYVVIGIWVGLSHPRFTALALAPVLALSFGLPLVLAHASGAVFEATVIVTCVSVFVGEVLALLRVRLERTQAELLEARERRVGMLTHGTNEVAIVFDADGAITYVSPGSERVFGYDPNDILQMTVMDFMTDYVDQTPRNDWSQLLGETAVDAASAEVTETRVRHREGHWVDVEAVGQDRTDDPDIRGFVYNIRDITARKQLERRLERHAFYDELTGLPNRAHFLARVAARVENGEQVAVLFVDLDGFKAINDTAGHHVGDQLLRLVAGRLRNALADAIVLARFGGDEFAAALSTSDAEAARASAEAFVRSVRQPFRIGERSIAITASVGIAVDEHAELNADDLVRAADTAMYVAKSRPAAPVVAYEPSMHERLVARLNLESEIRDAIDDGQFVLHYQPIMDLRTGLPSACEALVRWRHPRLGVLPPARFIDVAEQSGSIVALGRWVVEQACRDATRWAPIAGRLLKVGVNVSARQFQDADLVTDVRRALAASGLEPTRLKIEVTESVLLSDMEPALARLHALRDLGALLALDDFGTGYSSLSYLQTLPFDVLKIDKAFVDHITSKPRDLALINTINQLGHDLGLETLAEGVETADQDRLVRDLGVDYGQGFLYAPPLPLDALERFLADRARARPLTVAGIASRA